MPEYLTKLIMAVPDRDVGKLIMWGTYVFDVWTCPYTGKQYPPYLATPTHYAAEDGGAANISYSPVPTLDIEEYIVKDKLVQIQFNVIQTADTDLYGEPYSKGYACLATDATTKITGSDCFVFLRGETSLIAARQRCIAAADLPSGGSMYGRTRCNKYYENGFIGPLPSPFNGQKQLIITKIDTIKLPDKTIASETLPTAGLLRFTSDGLGINRTFIIGSSNLNTIASDGKISASGTPSIEGTDIKFPIRTTCPAFKTRAGQVPRVATQTRNGIGLIYNPNRPTLSVKNFSSPYSSVPSITLDTNTTDYGVVMTPTFTFGVRKLKQVAVCGKVEHINTGVSCTVPDSSEEKYHSTLKKWVITDIYNICISVSLKCIGNTFKVIWTSSIITNTLPVIGWRIAAIRWNEVSSSCGLNQLVVAANAQAAMDTRTYIHAQTGEAWMSGANTVTNDTTSGEETLPFNSTFQLDIPYAVTKEAHVTITFDSAGNLTVFSATLDALTDGSGEASRYGAWYVAN